MDREKLRTKLQALCRELERQEQISEVDRAPVELDQTSVGRLSRIDAMQVQAMALANQRRRQSELQRVKAALDRIDTDEFGYCQNCGDPIAPARVEHNPAVTTCISCAS
ncbi:TraR/DksA C4-type zinc finger protein [Sphingomonas sp.]|jgi:DnaK suppressor protein|uniref:TraR/DksA family transcriptional regulator n=1 Tax=Sphingomonas sp. TaxID=28214 RepID=UPI0017E4F453|nr:TraR/DksA C4-type zinc finger protein [Sphingomonas sp.]MBA3511204.1 TraR/DksA C4-type zinc finger protein [Sphingomonas sp.]